MKASNIQKYRAIFYGDASAFNGNASCNNCKGCRDTNARWREAYLQQNAHFIEEKSKSSMKWAIFEVSPALGIQHSKNYLQILLSPFTHKYLSNSLFWVKEELNDL